MPDAQDPVNPPIQEPDPPVPPPPNPPEPDPAHPTQPRRTRRPVWKKREGATEEEIKQAIAQHAAQEDLEQVLDDAINGKCEEEDYTYFVALNNNPTLAQAMLSED